MRIHQFAAVKNDPQSIDADIGSNICQHCGKSFRADYLEQHIRRHTAEKVRTAFQKYERIGRTTTYCISDTRLRPLQQNVFEEVRNDKASTHAHWRKAD